MPGPCFRRLFPPLSGALAAVLVLAGAGASAGTGVPAAQVVTWAASPDRLAASSVPDLTHRLIVRVSAGGSALRVRVTNAFGEAALTLGSAYAGERADGAALVPGTNRPLTFAGLRSVTVPPGRWVYSDPVPMTVRPGADLAVSLHVRDTPGTVTGHRRALQTSYTAPAGDHAAEESAAPFTHILGTWPHLDAVVVDAPTGTGAVAALGDSITDGLSSTPDTNRRWPDLLAARLRAEGATSVKGVANAGISGNRVLADGTGESAVKRLDRDVLGHRGLRSLILFEGVNDIKSAAPPTADQLMAGYRDIVTRAHAAGVCVIGATILPYEGWPAWTPAGEALRQEVNTRIREDALFDAVADFDASLRDPAHPTRLHPSFDAGDHLHPNDTGMRATADAVDVGALECARGPGGAMALR
ncbi:SGNH/GDSL hydrolase family protein [Streptomyces sp. NPDC005805]|uniref:SGNH/GDSL hydrolase family protein n=1 Tax=Streptomyces sp. NPDC005805 TaxID=3157068 RepID=UPI0033C8CABE